MDKINCGGFYLGEGLELDGNVLNATGSGGGIMVVNAVMSSGGDSFTMDKTYDEINAAFPSVVVSFRFAENDPTPKIYVPTDKVEGVFVAFQSCIFDGASTGKLTIINNIMRAYQSGDNNYSSINYTVRIETDEPV